MDPPAVKGPAGDASCVGFNVIAAGRERDGMPHPPNVPMNRLSGAASKFILLTLVCSSAPLRLQAQKDGLRPKIGGTPHSSGFALGVEFRKNRLVGDRLDFHGQLVGSIKKYELAELHLELPRLWKERLFFELNASYRNFPEEDFWGLGPRSTNGQRTNFRYEDAGYGATVGFRPLRQLRVGLSGGLLRVNTGPGKDKSFPSIEQLFVAGEVPALDGQPDYYRVGGFMQLDHRDRPSNPKSGGLYQFHWTYYRDRDLGEFSFRRYEVELQHFVATFQKRGTIALRGLTSLTDTRPSQKVPFFMQPTVGGANDLRGFHQYRFRDRNRLVLNLEYRWEALALLDLVAFADAGKVFDEPSQLGLNGLKGSFGGGGRIKFNGRVFLGLDLAVSSEGGFRLWVRRSHIF